MKIFLLVIATSILSFSIAKGQDKKGFIVDPDGYSNLRESANGQSKVITKILDGEIFKYKESESSWYSVETYNGKKGFMHKSRIKEFKINKDFCFNPNFTELFLFKKEGKVLSVCGVLGPNINDSKYYSGLVVYDGLNEIKMLEFYEGNYQTFDFIKGDIIIKEYSRLPIDKEFNTGFVPYSINKVMFAGSRSIVVKNAPNYNYPKLSKQEIHTKIDSLKQAKLTEQDYYKVIDIALVLALNDLTLGESIFLNLNQELDLHLDGEYYENYYKALGIYQINKNNR
jgi:uncharacterized protein YgiM (DUF1202 family)